MDNLCAKFLLLLFLAFYSTPSLAKTTLILESWRDDDQAIWQKTILPAFEAEHPDIRVTFRATNPTDYDNTLRTRLKAGKAGDLITCRPFNTSRALHQDGHLANLNGLPNMVHFTNSAKLAWQTRDQATTFCVPVASVIHGFLYNKEIFHQHTLTEPNTQASFFAVLEKLRTDSDNIPMALGTRDRWEAATMGYNNIGPNYWRGEEGRAALISGQQKLSDTPWTAPFQTLSKWRPYLGQHYQTQSYQDSKNLFTSGKAAIYPAGSWEIRGFFAQSNFEIGAFPPPVQKSGDTCYISDHPDMAIGLNTSSKNKAAALHFLNWVASAKFVTLYTKELPGFFPMSKHPVQINNPVAKTFLSWRTSCHSSIRLPSQIPSGNTPKLEQAIWNAAVDAITGAATPEQLGVRLQKELEKQWRTRSDSNARPPHP